MSISFKTKYAIGTNSKLALTQVNKISIYILLMFLLNCRNNNHCYDEFINEFTKGNFDEGIPPAGMNLAFFCRIEDDKIAITNNYTLYSIYSKKYTQQHGNFKLFLCSLYKSNLSLTESDFLNFASQNEYIIFLEDAEISNLNVNEIKEKYIVIGKDNGYEYLRQDLQKKDIFNI